MRRLGILALLAFAFVFSFWWNYHFNNAKVTGDPTSAADLAGAKEAAQPLLDALDKYHAENGVYPTTLDQLTGAGFNAQLPAHGRHGFLYSGDWVYKSDACAARNKELHGWVMKEVKDYQRQIDEFKQECVAGYREYHLQSSDFPPDAQTQPPVERWAYFDSKTKQWSLGWCAVTGRHNQQMSTNGVCRWGQRGKEVVW
jgi:hypothetical protein